jgi:hypothetical protein
MSFLSRTVASSLGAVVTFAALGALAGCTSTTTGPEFVPLGDGGLQNPNLNDDAGPPNPAGTGDFLEGVTLGDGTVPNTQLRRSIPVTLLPGSGSFAVVDGYIVKSSPTDNTAEYSVVRVKNTADHVQCYVDPGTVSLLDSTGKTLYSGTMNRAIGFTGKTPAASKAYGDCIEPGGVGIFIDIEENIAPDNVASISMQVTGDTMVSKPLSRMVAQGYTAVSGSSGQDITVNVINEGSAPGVVSSLSPSVLLDDNLVPIQWEYFNAKDKTPVSPNTATTQTAHLYFHGSASHLLISVASVDN